MSRYIEEKNHEKSGTSKVDPLQKDEHESTQQKMDRQKGIR